MTPWVVAQAVTHHRPVKPGDKTKNTNQASRLLINRNAGDQPANQIVAQAASLPAGPVPRLPDELAGGTVGQQFLLASPNTQ